MCASRSEATADRFATFVEVLQQRSAERAALPALSFLDNGETIGAELTYAELDRRARAIAVDLRAHLAVGDRALLLFPPGLDFIAAFIGCLYAGVIAVPAYPPRRQQHLARLGKQLTDAGARLALTTRSLQARLEKLVAEAGFEIAWLASDAVDEDQARCWTAPDIDGDSLAFLQYTSGSTSTPKGVMVRHRDLLVNESMIQQAFRQSAESIVVGWLPLYHDMGLIGNVLQPLYLGARAVLMSPLAFLQRPYRWLSAISRFRATTSGGPNFGYELCLRKIGEEQRRSLDLSSWRVAFNGAEPVNGQTLERFAAGFAAQGFSRDAFYPCYGLAEATLFVSGDKSRPRPRFLGLERRALEEGRVVRSAGGEGRQVFVSCGLPLAGQRLRIVDPQTRREVEAGRVGEIWIGGGGVTTGYWRRPDASAETFAAYLENGEGPFLRSGDLGFLDDGELLVTGRLKELIILRGRNYYPQDLEAVVAATDPDLRPGGGAAFSVEIDGEEQLVMVYEAAKRRQPDSEAVLQRARRALAEVCDVHLYALTLIRAGHLPKTSSGKIQRRLCREMWLDDRFEPIGGAPAGVAAAKVSTSEAEIDRLDFDRVDAEALRAADRSDRRAQLTDLLRLQIARLLRLPAARLAVDQPLHGLGFDSLMAIEFKSQIEEKLAIEMSIAELLAGPTIEQLAADLSSALEAPPNRRLLVTKPDGPAAGPAPLSYGQRALWFLHRLEPTSARHHIFGAARAGDGLDVELLRRCFGILIERHAALRTTFHEQDDELQQVEHETLELDFIDLGAGHGTDPAAVDEPLAGAWLREVERPFDLEKGPLLRLVVGGEGERSTVLLVIHHIVGDFWSLEILLGELAELYASRAQLQLPEQTVTAADFALWQEHSLAGEDGDLLWSFWRRRLAGELPILDLPTDRPRQKQPSDVGQALGRRLDAGLTSRLEGVARAHGTTLSTLLLTAWNVLLWRLTRQRDLLVGLPTAGRPWGQLSRLVGYFVNPVAVRAELPGDPPFSTALEHLRKRTLEAFAHQDFPFALLAERLQPERDPSFSPIYQTMFVYHKARHRQQQELAGFALGESGFRLSLAGLELTSLKTARRPVEVDLTLTAARIGDQLGLSFLYRSELFDPTTLQRLADGFCALLDGLSLRPEDRLGALPLLAPAERHQMLHEWCGPESEDGAAGDTLHGLFEEQAARQPAATALVAGEERLSYRQLERRSRQLACRLRECGVGAETAVAVKLDRGAELPIALLAVLRAGGFYVPIDPAYPPARQELMRQDSGARLLIDAAELERLEATPGRGDDELTPNAGAENLAYAIYTSGSTGRPKGVMIRHRGAVARMRWALRCSGPQRLAGVLAATSVCFDLSVFELFAPLASGGKVLLANDILSLPDLAAASEVTLINTVPSAISELIDLGPLPAGVRTVYLAGEKLERRLIDRLYALDPVKEVCDLYGPSEDTIYSTAKRAARQAEAPHTIGRPLDGGRALIADPRLRLQPIGVAGELLLGGEALARGYLGRPALTAERFVADAWSVEAGARLYRSGDLARLLPNGEVVFLGRLDQQVKVRGFRIELGEIAVLLEQQPEVREATVAALDGSRLVAYVVPEPADAGQRGTIDELRESLAAALPAYMVPDLFIELAQLPRTPNGKLDRGALPRPATATAGSEEPPRGPVEEVVGTIWCAVLERGSVGRNENFFALGGHSLLAARVISRLRQTLGAELPLSALFEAPTVAGLARRLEELREPGPGAARNATIEASDEPRAPLSFAQERLWFVEQLGADGLYNELLALRLEGAVETAALGRALNAVVERHAVLRSRFEIVDGSPRAQIRNDAAVELRAIDLGPASVHEAARQLVREPFDLGGGDLLRATLLQRDEDQVLLLSAHHIVIDGWSWRLLLRELALLYRAAQDPATADGGLAAVLPPLPVQYQDFARWQRRHLDDELLTQLLTRWRQLLGDAPPTLELPLDRPRPAVQRFTGTDHGWRFEPALSEALRQLARDLTLTPFMLFATLFKSLLQRHSAQRVITLGSPISQRPAPELEGLLGLFLNNLVLATDLGDDPSVEQAAQRVRQVALAAYELQELPFERLVEAFETQRDLSRSPLFQVVLVLHGEDLEIPDFPGLEVEHLQLDLGRVKFDLVLDVTDGADGFSGRWQYRSDLFDRTTIQRLAQQLQALAERWVEMPRRDLLTTRLSELEILTPAQRHQLLREWGCGTRGERPALRAALGDGDPTVLTSFLAQAERAPHALAVAGGGHHLSYRELQRRARWIAARLAAERLAAEEAVGVLVERRLEWVAGILGVLLAGGAYVPMDPAYPRQRLRQMLRDTGMRLLLSDRDSRERLEPADLVGTRVIAVESSPASGEATVPAARPHADQLAYVIFTSGSSGRPKGVMVPHRGLANLVAWHAERYALEAEDRTSLVAGLGFDASVWEMWPTLARGASLHLAPEAARLSAAETVAWLERERIRLSFLPTPLAEDALRDPWPMPSALRALLTGGDRLHGGLARRRPPLINHYGPTESSVVATAGAVGEDREPPIGRPIRGLQVHLFDPWLRPAALGAAGELMIGGAGLARGYWAGPARTAERFVPDPLATTPGARLYRTGDLARWRTDGELLFVGRFDHQVKVRGFRIELGEIEVALQRSALLRGAAVVARADERGENTLVAYVVPERRSDVSLADELRRRLGEILPSYMVPAIFVELDDLPLTQNGKLDRAALPAAELKSDFIAPRDPAEEQIAALWAEILEHGPVGVSDDFFALGGHSLLATRMLAQLESRFGVKLPLRDLFADPTVAGLARRIGELEGETVAEPRLEPVSRQQPLVASSAQQRLWFFDRLRPESPLYNVPVALRLRGELDVEALAGGLNRLLERHEALRTRFAFADGELVQQIDPPPCWRPELIDLSADADAEAAARDAIHRLASRSFDLARGPLWRGALLRLAPRDHQLILVLHHIVCDGWSMEILIDELARFYETASAAGSAPALPELPVQYADYAAWQRRFLAQGGADDDAAYWLEQLGGELPVLDLPTDRPRPAEPSFSGARRALEVPATTVEGLASLARRHGCSVFMVLLGAWAVLLHRSSGQLRLTIGFPVANRQRPETQNLVGFFVNPLVLALDLRGRMSLADLLGQVRRRLLDGEAHQDLPFERLVELLPGERQIAHAPLFQTVVALRDAAAEKLRFPGLEIEIEEPETGTAKFDLTLHAALAERGLGGWLEYSTELFDPTHAERLVSRFTLLLTALARPGAGELQVGELDLLDAAERHQVLIEHNDCSSDYDRQATLHQLFDRQAAAAGERLAVNVGEVALSYRELKRRSDRLADALAALGCGAETAVALMVERSPEQIIALLGILKAGGYYLPLDPEYPDERLELMLDSAQVRWLLGDREHAERRVPDRLERLLLDDLLNAEARPATRPTVGAGQLAYAMFTSGSTGRPKGVAVPHRAIVRLVSETNFATFGAEQTLLHAAPISFDASTLEIWGALLHGARLALPPVAKPDPARLGRCLLEERVSTLWLTEALFHRMVADRPQDLRHLRQLLAGGDALRPADVERVLSGPFSCSGTLINGYGPTENTTFTCCHPMDRRAQAAAGTVLIRGKVPIGRPIANTSIYIVDRATRAVPPGVAGELLTGGDGLARGYLGQPAQTASRFIPSPFAGTGERLYRTGDLVRQRAGAAVEFLGRIDLQVKVRGFRLEPGEIERTLLRHPDVAEAVVLARADAAGDKMLIAYTVAPGAEDGAPGPSFTELRDFALEHLPAYMVPTHFVSLETLPVSPNGKIDRSALPLPSSSRPDLERELVAPRNEAEEVLAAVWSEILGVDRVGVHDDFFELGGHSIAATRVAMEVREQFGVELELSRLFHRPTIAELVLDIEEAILAELESEGLDEDGSEDPAVRELETSTVGQEE